MCLHKAAAELSRCCKSLPLCRSLQIYDTLQTDTPNNAPNHKGNDRSLVKASRRFPQIILTPQLNADAVMERADSEHITEMDRGKNITTISHSVAHQLISMRRIHCLVAPKLVHRNCHSHKDTKITLQAGKRLQFNRKSTKIGILPGGDCELQTQGINELIRCNRSSRSFFTGIRILL